MISWYRNIIFFYLCKLVSSKTTGVNKDVIGFPEYEENPLLANKQHRMPVYLPAQCPENELYYPGDQTDDWICDCRPGFLFHPNTDKCWLAYQQGPCPEEQYLVLPKDSMIPVCVPNPCKAHSMVLWKGECQKLGSSVCGDSFPVRVLWVNATNLTIDCVEIKISNRYAFDFEIETTTTCPLGCRRHIYKESPTPKATVKMVESESAIRKFVTRVQAFVFRIFNYLV